MHSKHTSLHHEQAMPKLHLYLHLLCALLFSQAFAQSSRAWVEGKVLDSVNEQPLEHVQLRVSGAKIRATSDSLGCFYLSLPANTAFTVEVERSGYLKQESKLHPTAPAETLRVTLRLVARPYVFGAVVIEERLDEPLHAGRSAEAAMRQPGAFEDPLRNLQQLPGVTLRSDWDSQISVRGASPDQNLVVIDGFTLPNPYRLQFALGGGLSLINFGILRRAQLWKSGFSPRFGDRLAGLIVFETKAIEEHERELRVNLFDASLHFALPLAQQRSGILLAVRRNYHDALEQFISLKNFAFPRWQDVQLKAGHQFNSRHRIEALAIGSKEWTDLGLGKISKDRVNERAKTVFAGVAQRVLFDERTLWENYVSYFQGPSRLRYTRTELEERFTLADYHFDDRAWQWRSELTRGLDSKSQWLLGFDLTWQRQWANLELEVLNADSPLVLPQDYSGRRWRRIFGMFFERRFTFSEAFVLRPGLRLAGQTLNENLNAEPRLTLAGKIQRLNYRLHTGLYYQSLDWQSLFRREWPMDVRAWRTLSRERATLASADFSFTLGKGWQLAAGVYWRHMNPFIVPIDESEGTILEFRANSAGADYPSALQANRPRVTHARQRGVELALSRNHPTWNFDLRYAYARSHMRDLDNARWIPAITDRPHEVALDLSRRLGAHVQLNSFLRYASGQPHTPVTGIWRDENHNRWPNGLRFEYAPRNSARFEDYLRWDVRATFEFNFRSAQTQFYLEWLNVTNQKNMYQFLWIENDPRNAQAIASDSRAALAQQPITMLPRLVVGGLAVRF